MRLTHLMKERQSLPLGGLWYVRHREFAPGYRPTRSSTAPAQEEPLRRSQRSRRKVEQLAIGLEWMVTVVAFGLALAVALWAV